MGTIQRTTTPDVTVKTTTKGQPSASKHGRLSKQPLDAHLATLIASSFVSQAVVRTNGSTLTTAGDVSK